MGQNNWISLSKKGVRNPYDSVCYIINKIKVLFGMILFIILYIKRRDKEVWVFGYGGGKGYADNSKHLFEYTDDEVDEITAVWISSEKKVVNNLKKEGRIACRKKSLQGILYTLNAEYGFITHSRNDLYWPLTGGMTIINLTHGIPYKRYRWANDGEAKSNGAISYIKNKYVSWNFDYVISPSEKYVSPISEAERVNEKDVIVTGLPRHDIHRMCESVDDIKKLKNDVNNDLIFYFPTWREHEDASLFGDICFKKLNNFLCNNDAEMIVIAHRNMGDLNENKDGLSNITFPQDSLHFGKLFMQSDLFITDYSSLTYDAVLYDVPTIYYNHDYREYTMYRDFFFEYEKITPGPKVSSFPTLLEKIKYCLDGCDDYVDQRQELYDDTFKYSDGYASSRIVEFVTCDQRK